MKILQLISSEGLYGAEKMMLDLSGELSRIGCEVTVGVFQNGRGSHAAVASAARARGFDLRQIPCSGRWDWSTVGRLRREVDNAGFDVAHCHGYKADVYALLARRRRSPALVSTCHSWPDGAKILQLYAAIDRAALRAFDEVATMSPEVIATLVRSGVAQSKVQCIWNGVDPAGFEGAKATLGNDIPLLGQPVVGLVARLVPGKGAPTLLRAARRVLAFEPGVTFALVGDGPARTDFQRMAEDLGVAQNVVLTGVRTDMPGVYASLDVLVLPSAQEAMPMTLLEGMAAGLPVIATAVGAVPELVLHEKTGYLVPVGDADALADSIIRLLRDRRLAAAIGRAGREHVRANFSLARTAENYLALYERALQKRRAGSLAHAAVQQL